MQDLIPAIILLLLALSGVVMRKTYFYLPLHELKRKAEHQDETAASLYRAAAFGNSLRGLLWLYIGLTGAAGIVLLARQLPVWVCLLIVGPLLWIAFSLIPASRTTRLGTRLTLLVTPFIAWLMNYLHPLLSRAADLARRRYTAPNHTRLFERDDLLELIERQQSQADNRVSEEELEVARRALSFGDYKVADVLTPRKQIKTVLADDIIGPILIDEVHQSGQESVLVRDSKKGPVIGSLGLSQLGLNSQGKVRDVMNPTVYYLHANDSLSEALHAFFVTNHPLFVVVNSSEEYVGIVTIESIVRQLLGHVPGDDFDQYTDLAAVANRHPKKAKKPAAQEDSQETPVKTEDEVVE
jgi:CBS domain containing-hemolysin-like protein